jgi:NADH pyrophosphatase NudC (nudix superfamily)
VFEEHRQHENHAALRGEKLASLDALYTELDTLERALRDRRELLVLREPGITACPQCATIHGSEAKFCPNCGTPTQAPATRRRAAGVKKP